MDYSKYRDLKVVRTEPGILELVMGEEGARVSTVRRELRAMTGNPVGSEFQDFIFMDAAPGAA